MRPLFGVLACIGLGGPTLAFADEPPAASPTSPTAASTTAAAPKTTAPPASAASTTTPKDDTDERQLIAEGYHAEMRHGQKLFCRREQALGSRLGGHQVCGTVEEIKAMTRASQDAVNEVQRNQGVVSGH
jgi:hypothetical protein